jgi:hypothetical protein
MIALGLVACSRLAHVDPPAPVGTPWMWTLALGYHEDRMPTQAMPPRARPPWPRSRRAGGGNETNMCCCRNVVEVCELLRASVRDAALNISGDPTFAAPGRVSI